MSWLPLNRPTGPADAGALDGLAASRVANYLARCPLRRARLFLFVAAAFLVGPSLGLLGAAACFAGPASAGW